MEKTFVKNVWLKKMAVTDKKEGKKEGKKVKKEQSSACAWFELKIRF